MTDEPHISPLSPTRFEVRNEELEALLRDLGRNLKSKLPEGWAFTLLLQSIGEKDATFYISSVDREDNIKALQEFLDRQKEIPKI